MEETKSQLLAYLAIIDRNLDELEEEFGDLPQQVEEQEKKNSDLAKTVKETEQILEDTSDNTRKRCVIVKKIEYEKVADIEEILLTYSQFPLIIYANTVNKAIDYYNFFKYITSQPHYIIADLLNQTN